MGVEGGGVPASNEVCRLKKLTTTWKLLIWAYRSQMVQYEVDRHAEYARGTSMLDELVGSRSRQFDGRGCINGAGTTAHEDAHIVHNTLSHLQPNQQHLLIKTAAKGERPEWDPVFPPFRVVPVRRGGSGAIRMIYGRKHKPIGCWIDYEGIPDAEASAIRAKARAMYSTWWEALRTLTMQLRGEHLFERWRVNGIGAIRDPWENGY